MQDRQQTAHADRRRQQLAHVRCQVGGQQLPNDCEFACHAHARLRWQLAGLTVGELQYFKSLRRVEGYKVLMLRSQLDLD